MLNIVSYDIDGQIFVSPTALFMQTSVEAAFMIAVRLRFDPESKVAYWNDTIRERSLTFIAHTISKEKITFISEDQKEWIFKPLTLSIFNEIKKDLAPIKNEPASDEEVQAFYSS